MNDLETNFQRSSLESFPPEPSKLSAYQQKLRQLVKKSPNPIQSTSPTHFSHQLSKQTAEGTLWETCSPTVSRLSDCSSLVATKSKNEASLNSNVAVNSKFGSRNLLVQNIEDSKSKGSTYKIKSKVSSPSVSLGFASPTNMGNLNGKNHPESTKGNGFDPQSHINFLMFQPKTSQYQGKKPIKLNSYFHDDDDDKNLSLDNKTKSFMTPLYQPRRDLNSKNVSTESHEVAVSPQKENRGHLVINKENVDTSKSKNKSKTSQFFGDIKKSEKTLKKKLPSKMASIAETPSNKGNSTGNLGIKKRNFPIESEVVNEFSREKRDTTKKTVANLRYAVTPDNLTSRENEAIALEDSGDQQFNLLGDRKASVPLAKEIRLDSRNTRRSSNKGVRPKTGSKGVLKQESPCKAEVGGNRRRESHVLRAAKMSISNVLSNTINQSSAKNGKRGDSQVYGLGDMEKSNEMTLSAIQDTTANTKGASRKDLTEENEKNAGKAKRLMRAKSHGGAQIEEAIAEINKAKAGEKSKSKSINLKQKTNAKRTHGTFKSVDYKIPLDYKDLNASKSPSKNVQEMREKEENGVGKLKGEEKDHVAMLCQMVEKTSKLLCAYRERERNWQTEKKELLEKLNILKERENLQ